MLIEKLNTCQQRILSLISRRGGGKILMGKIPRLYGAEGRGLRKKEIERGWGFLSF